MAYSETRETCKMVYFAKIDSGFKSLIIIAKCSTLGVWQGLILYRIVLGVCNVNLLLLSTHIYEKMLVQDLVCT